MNYLNWNRCDVLHLRLPLGLLLLNHPLRTKPTNCPSMMYPWQVPERTFRRYSSWGILPSTPTTCVLLLLKQLQRLCKSLLDAWDALSRSDFWARYNVDNHDTKSGEEGEELGDIGQMYEEVWFVELAAHKRSTLSRQLLDLLESLICSHISIFSHTPLNFSTCGHSQHSIHISSVMLFPLLCCVDSIPSLQLRNRFWDDCREKNLARSTTIHISNPIELIQPKHYSSTSYFPLW